MNFEAIVFAKDAECHLSFAQLEHFLRSLHTSRDRENIIKRIKIKSQFTERQLYRIQPPFQRFVFGAFPLHSAAFL
jgi:hypothetical protein